MHSPQPIANRPPEIGAHEKAEAKTAPMRSIRTRRFVRQLHRWLGLLIGIQVLFWVGGGLLMSALRLDAVRGERFTAKPQLLALDHRKGLFPLNKVLENHQPAAVTDVRLTTFLGLPVYRLETSTGPQMLDAITGRPLSPLSESSVRAVALSDYAGATSIHSIDLIDTPAVEYRGRDLPLWRVHFNDERDTTLYISPFTGQVVARRNDLWRIFDFVWMLHIMDYQKREDFNHPLLIITAATTLAFVITGLFMLSYSFRRGRA